MRRLIAVFITGLVLQGCSGNSSSTRVVGTDVEEAGVSGYVGTATWGSRVSATPINLEGGPTLFVNESGATVFDGAASQSEQSGTYSLVADGDQLGESLVFIATADNGDIFYRCENLGGCSSLNYGAYVPLPDDFDIRAGVGELLDGMVVNINWITDLAASLAKTVYIDEIKNGISDDDRKDINEAILEQVDTFKTGIYNEYTMELANLHVSKLFGVSDIISVQPVAPSQITQVTSVSGERYVEGVYYGALIAVLPILAEGQSVDYMTFLSELTEDARTRKGQLLEKKAEDSMNDDITKYQLFSSAASLLRQNINYFQGIRATVPAGATTALEKLERVMAGLVAGRETNVQVDVPSELASWGTAIEQSRAFITDLTKAVKNFWGYDENEPAFVDPAHGRRVDAYYLAYELMLGKLAESTFGPGGVLNEILKGAEILATCAYGTGDCTTGAGYALEDGTRNKDTILIDGSLRLIMRPVETEDAEDGKFNTFDFEIETVTLDDSDGATVKSSLAIGNGKKFTWYTDVISDGSITTRPYIRLFFNESYDSPPISSFISVDDPAHTAPSQIALIWPLVRFNQNINDVGTDSGEHQFDVLIEANLVGVKDPLVDGSQVRYNPSTLVVKTRSQSLSDKENITETFMQLRTSNAGNYYPSTVWPETTEFFQGRSDAPATIDDMVISLYRNQEVVGGSVVEYFDEQVKGADVVNRIRLYPYDAGSNSTKTESCSVVIVGAERQVRDCNASFSLAGEVTLDSLLKRNFDNGGLSTYAIPANGLYKIDLAEQGIVNSNGDFVGLNIGQTYGPFDGAFFDDIEMGIERLSFVGSSFMENAEGTGLTPVVAELGLERRVDDLFSFSAAYGYGSEESFQGISDALGVVAGGDAQGFRVEYAVSEEEITNDDGGLDVIEVERGNWLISRSNVSLGGSEQSVLANIATRTEYTQGSAEEACGLNDRDKLSSAEGSCDAVAYLTVRGSLVGTIREEREDVFVVRFVDGTWMIIGG